MLWVSLLPELHGLALSARGNHQVLPNPGLGDTCPEREECQSFVRFLTERDPAVDEIVGTFTTLGGFRR